MQKYLGLIKKLGNFFRRDSEDDRSLLEKMRDKYRLVIMNDETFEEVTSLKLTPLSVYIFLSSLVVGTAMLVALLVVYTPLKRYIPGYGDFKRDSEIAGLVAKVTDLEEEIEAHRAYNENFRKILVGDVADLSKEAVERKSKTPSAASDPANNTFERVGDGGKPGEPAAKASSDRSGEAAMAGLNPILSKEQPLEQLFFMPPVSGEVTSPFDLRKSHFGVDVAAPKNTAVKAAADGVVISAGYTVETGYSIAIQHPNNVVTMYKHNSVLLKQSGSSVKAGEAIAIIGNTGETSTGPHLHFELWHKGRAVNPSDYISFN